MVRDDLLRVRRADAGETVVARDVVEGGRRVRRDASSEGRDRERRRSRRDRERDAPEGVDAAVEALPDAIARDDADLRAIHETGQARLWWQDTPIDLFFAYDVFHDAVDSGAVDVPFADTTIRVLSATHLTVCKVVFDRPRDWVDIDAMVDADAAIDAAEVMRWIGRICGDTDRRYVRIAAVLLR